jgi:putative ABC transport system ATP-binding protein
MNQAQIKQSTQTAKTLFAMENISKVYRTELIETHALRDFSLQVNEGEFVAITGPSGSGKTTFLNIAGLLETYNSGDYFLDGINTRSLNDNQLSQLRNTRIGFVFQGFNLIPDLNAYDNIEVPLRYRNMHRSERKERVQQALARVGLESRAQHFPAQLSGGQQQRIAVARAIAGSPAFILADEPTGNLDSLMARQVMELLEDINDQGTTIIMVTHDQDLARRTQRHIQIIDGQVTEVFKHV